MYSPEIAAAICERVATSGDSLVKILKDDGMPSYTTVYKWRAENNEFADNLARAREDRADYLAEQVTDISDEIPVREVVDSAGGTSTAIDAGGIQRNKLRCDVRIKLMQVLKPKSYDPAKKVELSGADGGPIQCITKSILE